MPKHLDRAFNTFTIDDPPVLAELFSHIRREPGTIVRNATKRIPGGRLDPDCILSVVTGKGERLLHYEAFANWRAEVPERMYWYAKFHRRQTGKSVESTVILFRPLGAGGLAAEYVYEFDDDHLWGGIKFRIIKLWEMDPEEVFRLFSDTALPWVVFMRKSEAVLRRVLARISELAKTDRAAASRVAADVIWFSGMRYDWNELEREVLRSIKVYIKHEVMRESSYYQELLAEGAAEGEARGEARGVAKGRAEGMMQSLTAFLTSRYPGLESTRGIGRLAAQPADAIERVFKAVIAASDRQAAQNAIKSAIRER